MARQLNLYRYVCISGTQFEEWSEEIPISCPNGNAVSSGTLAIIDSVSDQDVSATIVEESIATGGHFQGESVTVNISGTDWAEVDHSWPIPISIVAAHFTTDDTHQGDIIQAHAAPNTTIGAATAVISGGQSTFSVQQSVVDNISLGFLVTLVDSNDGATEELGRVIDIDKENLTITTEDVTSQALAISPAPTYVQMTIAYINHMEIGPPRADVVGEGNLKASYFPANTILRFRYKRVDGTADKLVVRLEYFY
ncbi:MAG: hypothetical protein DRQ40_00425 [Gammaproteobacteria bacterium]|nr:MAG: hypothetical protein DRQ40_00425 [Gammaproteobacteria bacterium]